MKIGATQVLLNHPVVIVGATGFAEDLITVPLDEPPGPSASHRHLAVPARAQVAPVFVNIWRGPHPAIGFVAFDGSVDLADGALAIFDVDALSRFTRKIGPSGIYRLMIRVDDPSRASRVDLVIDRGNNEASISRLREYSLPSVQGVSEPLTPAAVLGLILADHDLPVARLANALDLVVGESFCDASSRAPILRSARVRNIIDWLKLLSPYASPEHYRELGISLEEKIARLESPDDEGFAVSTAVAIIQSIQKSG